MASAGGLMILAVYATGASLFSTATGYVAVFGVAFYAPLPNKTSASIRLSCLIDEFRFRDRSNVAV